MKLDNKQTHVLTLIGRDADEKGWTPISEQLFPALSQMMPSELTVFEKLDVGGRAKLTEQGKSVLYAMQWI